MHDGPRRVTWVPQPHSQGEMASARSLLGLGLSRWVKALTLAIRPVDVSSPLPRPPPEPGPHFLGDTKADPHLGPFPDLHIMGSASAHDSFPQMPPPSGSLPSLPTERLSMSHLCQWCHPEHRAMSRTGLTCCRPCSAHSRNSVSANGLTHHPLPQSPDV
jgi:hypothetical protein